MKKRSFTQLKKEKDVKELNSLCKKVVESYAKSSGEFSQTYYCDHYNISKSCFGRMRDYAVITELVSEDIAWKATQKGISNQQAHSSEAGRIAMQHYYDLLRKRVEYIIYSFSAEEIKEIAERFANESSLSKAELATKTDTSIKVIDNLLKRAIIENIISDEIFEKIKERSIKNSATPSNTKEFFERLRSIRINNQNSNKATLK